MAKKRGVVLMLLLCALVFCAVTAPAATAYKQTTAYTCLSEKFPTEKSKGFSDEHCTKTAEGTNVKFVHEKIPAVFKTTQLSVTNNETGANTVPTKFFTTIKTQELQLEAAAFQSCDKKTWVWNVEIGGVQRASGLFCGEFTKITVKKPEKCKILNDAIKLDVGAAFETVVEEGESEDLMYVKFLPPLGPEPGEKLPFATFEVIGAECPLAGEVVEVEGYAWANVMTSATPLDGATLKFDTDYTSPFLEVDGYAAGLEGSFTPRMLKEEGKDANPVSLTTEEFT